MREPKIPTKYVGARLKSLAHAFGRKFEETARKNGIDEVTMMHGRILGLLYYNRDSDVYQRDLETVFNITRSSVTGIVKLMEKKGYLLRESVPGDARLKKLTLTPLGIATHEKVIASLNEVEEAAVAGMTEGELRQFMALSERMKNNLTTQKERPPC